MSGKTAKARPWAAWALPATSPRKICSHAKAAANTTHSARASSASPTVPPMRNPTTKPTTTVTTVPHMMSAVSAMARPSSTEPRFTGRDRRRSKNPDSESSAVPHHPAANSPLTAASAGMRKST